MMLGGWGNYPNYECRTISARGAGDLAKCVAGEPSLIARGNGRAYGDAALNPHATLLTSRHNRILAFDVRTGIVHCESGVLLSDILDTFVPLGWFPVVSPGTKYVTVGGMIASDVHGKNHHLNGSFSRYLEELELIAPSGDIIHCSPELNSEIFNATCGGMELTGVIASARFRLQRIETAWIRRRAIRCSSLEETIERIEANNDWSYSAAWIDCLATGKDAGRSIIFLGEHAKSSDLEAGQSPFPRRKNSFTRLPLPVPSIFVNSVFIGLFNEAYFNLARTGDTLVDYDNFFYPIGQDTRLEPLLWASGVHSVSVCSPKECEPRWNWRTA